MANHLKVGRNCYFMSVFEENAHIESSIGLKNILVLQAVCVLKYVMKLGLLLDEITVRQSRRKLWMCTLSCNTTEIAFLKKSPGARTESTVLL